MIDRTHQNSRFEQKGYSDTNCGFVLGMVPGCLEKILEEMEIREGILIMQTTVLLRPA